MYRMILKFNLNFCVIKLVLRKNEPKDLLSVLKLDSILHRDIPKYLR